MRRGSVVRTPCGPTMAWCGGIGQRRARMSLRLPHMPLEPCRKATSSSFGASPRKGGTDIDHSWAAVAPQATSPGFSAWRTSSRAHQGAAGSGTAYQPRPTRIRAPAAQARSSRSAPMLSRAACARWKGAAANSRVSTLMSCPRDWRPLPIGAARGASLTVARVTCEWSMRPRCGRRPRQSAGYA